MDGAALEGVVEVLAMGGGAVDRSGGKGRPRCLVRDDGAIAGIIEAVMAAADGGGDAQPGTSITV
jgi:hypothetical protein